MTPETALAALMALAGSIGVAPVAAPAPPPAASAAPETPRPILRLTLDEIRRDQDRAFQGYPLGRSWLELSVGLDPAAELWIKFRQGGEVLGRTVKALSDWNDLDLPGEPARAIYENGLLRFHPALDPRAQHTVVPVPGLIRGLYDASLHVLLGGAVDYAVVVEDGPVPESLCLLRRDNGGTIWVTHRSKAEMAELQWFLAVNGTLYGMRMEGDSLVFYSKPVPPAGAAAVPGEIRLP